MNPLGLVLSDSVLMYLASVAAASLLVTGATIVILRCCRSASLPLQHAVLTSALVAAIAGPALLAVLAANGVALVQLPPTDGEVSLPFALLSSAERPPVALAELPNASRPTKTAVADVAATRVVPAVVEKQRGAVARELMPARANTIPWTWSDVGRWLAIVWGAGCLGSLYLLGVGLWRLRALASSCHTITDQRVIELAETVGRSMGLSETPTIYESSAATVPLTMGLMRPCVVVPNDVATVLTAEQLRGLLCHEIGHIVRRDAFIGMLQRVSLAMYWWNPLLRSVSAAISEVREQICDDLATRDVDASSTSIDA